MILRFLAFLAIATVISPLQSRAATPTLTTLATFNFTDGSQPAAGVIADANGNLFGTTVTGGANDYGTVFEIAKTASGYASNPITLYSFCKSLPPCTDGANPSGGVIADTNGNLFGTTFNGGAHQFGTVFEIPKTAAGGYASNPIILYSFCKSLSPCTDGEGPNGNLIANANGNLFGTTFNGGAHQFGTVFELLKTAEGYDNTLTILYSFCAQSGCADGATPSGGLTVDANGNLFGMTEEGGVSGFGGTVFEIAKTASGYASNPITLYSFCKSLADCVESRTERIPALHVMQ
ncbi:MAG: choice-of-anchor tandem repeat GloVer-containing protein [Stellaceae bacterium]